MHPDRHRSSPGPRLAACALVIGCLSASTLHAQTSDFFACTPGALGDCTEIRLTSILGAGTGGTTLFQIALRNVGSTTQPSLATTVYNLVFGTGLAAALGTEVSGSIVPVAIGGATLSDPSPWDLFETGDAIFLSAVANNGVGGCIAGAAVGGFGQAGNTCGAGQFLSFSFSTPRLFDPRRFTVLDLEVVGLTSGLPADSCGDQPACVITTTTSATPEPTTTVLLATGLALVLGGRGWRRRRSAAAFARTA